MNIKYYVIYDNEYNVVKITTEVDKNDNFFEINREEAAGFSIGTKSLQSYFVHRSELNVLSLEEKKFGDIEYMANDILEVGQIVNDVDLYINYSLKELSWKFTLAEKTKNFITVDRYQTILKFYIASKLQSNYLIRTIEFTIESLINNCVTINFATEDEKKFDSITIFTKKYFSKIGIKNDENQSS